MSVDHGNLYRLRPTSAESQHPNSWQPHQDAPKLPERRIWVALALLGILALVLIAQLVRYQAFGVVPKVDKREEGAAVDPFLARGSITDRTGYPLAIEYYTYDITTDPSIIKNPEDFTPDLGPLLDQDPGALAQKIRDNKKSRYLVLAKDMGPEVVKRIEQKNKERTDRNEADIPVAIIPKLKRKIHK